MGHGLLGSASAIPWEAALVITDRVMDEPACPHLIYRPPSLVFGIGCKRGVRWDQIEEMFQGVCRENYLSPLSLGVVASADLKADEPGLIEFAQRHQAELRFYRTDELSAVEELPTPSEIVQSKIGIPGVAEPAAMLAAGVAELVVTKQIGPGITMAVARRENV
jgi:cobalamin biosynthesis protein CbiG